MKIIKESISIDELKKMAGATFGDMIKAVVDIDREIVAIDAELHSDLEALLLEDGSKQNALWGINFYPELKGDDFIEFDSMINIRPSQSNMTRGIFSHQIRKRVLEVAVKRIKR